MRTSKQILYGYVSRARESCAGDDIRDTDKVLEFIEDAIDFASKCNATMILRKLLNIKYKMALTKEYADRLPIDQELCDILNNELRD